MRQSARLVMIWLLQSVGWLWWLSTITFLLTRSVPGGPFDAEQGMPELMRVQLQQQYHFDWPLWQQYGAFIWQLMQGDLGWSLSYPSYRVYELVIPAFLVSMYVGTIAWMLLWCWSALLLLMRLVAPWSWCHYLSHWVMFIGSSVPTFMMSPLVVYELYIRGQWLSWQSWDVQPFYAALLPAALLSLQPGAMMAKLIVNKLLPLEESAMYRMARAKGLSRRQVLLSHGLGHIMTVVSSYLLAITANLLTGSAIIERLFLLPGLGRYFIDAVIWRDYPVIIGVTMLYGSLLLMIRQLVWLLQQWLDPRQDRRQMGSEYVVT